MLVDAHDQLYLPTWEELIGDSILMDYNLEFDVNYSSGEHNFTLKYQLTYNVYRLPS